MNILHVDTNHPLLIEQLEALGHHNVVDISSSKTEIAAVISDYDGLVIRSRFSIDKIFLDQAKNLKFIARVGAGLENIALKLRFYAMISNLMLGTKMPPKYLWKLFKSAQRF